MKKRFFIELRFRGTGYHGWQRQPNATSIQETFEQSLSRILQEDIGITGAGRTDTGVHASYFVAHFDSTKEIYIPKLTHQLNSILPDAIAIEKIQVASKSAHARYDAISRTYRYLIVHNKPVFLSDLAYVYTHPLNLKEMNMAASFLPEYDDFTTFSKLHSNNKTMICKVSEAYFENMNNYTIFTIKANRFLRNMVRSITGTLLQVGREKIGKEEFRDIIASMDRSRASNSAPAEGLYLHDIEYPESYGLKNPSAGELIPFLKGI